VQRRQLFSKDSKKTGVFAPLSIHSSSSTWYDCKVVYATMPGVLPSLIFAAPPGHAFLLKINVEM
jgi:hypothetical protein